MHAQAPNPLQLLPHPLCRKKHDAWHCSNMDSGCAKLEDKKKGDNTMKKLVQTWIIA